MAVSLIAHRVTFQKLGIQEPGETDYGKENESKGVFCCNA